MDIANEYLQLMELVGQRLPLPEVQSMHIAPYEDDPEKSSKFGALILTDGTVGLTYTGLDDALLELQDTEFSEPLVGVSPLESARLFAGESAWQRSLGMAAINAISQFAFKHCGRPLPATGSTIDCLDLRPGDRVGMVGYFPPLVESIRALALPLTVVELDRRLWRRTDNFEVTEDPGKLRQCNKILCTGTVLVNHTADEVLQHCTDADTVLVAGPTVGCLPDPLFARGVTLVGGCTVTDTAQFLERWRTQTKWRKSTRRYVLDRSYPGCRKMLRAG
ncbi:MAG: DUF364 domain-containing protein [Gammaproteobacteria bacterium]|nr:DUF364 domain-containing protein [Gammaproteobacteria bacterium]